MAWATFNSWLKRFQTAAEQDRYQELNRLSALLGWGEVEDGEPFMTGTMQLVAYLTSSEGTLADEPSQCDQKIFRMQTYHARESKGGKYIIVVKCERMSWGRIVWDGLDFTDLAELYDTCNLRELVILKPDGRSIRSREHQRIMKLIENDIHFDDFGTDVKVLYEWTSAASHAHICSNEDDLKWFWGLLDRGMLVEFSEGDDWCVGRIDRKMKSSLTIKVPKRAEPMRVRFQDVLNAVRETPI